MYGFTVFTLQRFKNFFAIHIPAAAKELIQLKEQENDFQGESFKVDLIGRT